MIEKEYQSDYKEWTLVTHKNCMDGAGCAILYRALGGKEENIHFVNPNHEQSDAKVKELLESGLNVLGADMSISTNLVQQLIDSRDIQYFQLLDHHKSAIPLEKFGLSNLVIDKENTRCGCKMLYEHLLTDINGDKIKPYKDLVDYIDDHDRWMKNIPESDNLAMFYMTVGQKMFIERFVKNPSIEFTNQEKYVIEIEKNKMEEEIREKKRHVQSATHSKKINGKHYRIGFVTGVRYVSSTGNALYSDPTLNLDAVLLVGNETISLRCGKDSELDLSSLSKKFGGGGHKAAAGFQIKGLLGKSVIDMIVEKFPGEQ